jgi:rod shape-determining protein MreC
LRVFPSTSLVLMINDQSSGAGALLEKSRLQGVLRGTPNGELVLERVMSDEQVVPGETVLSSGGDQIFPKGLPVGTVTSVKPGHEMFLNIKVKPAADLGRLEEVLVVTERQERPASAENPGVHVRAADILAQRLPSVPDKPADGGAAPSTANSATTARANSTSTPATPAGTTDSTAKPAATSPTSQKPPASKPPSQEPTPQQSANQGTPH